LAKIKRVEAKIDIGEKGACSGREKKMATREVGKRT